MFGQRVSEARAAAAFAAFSFAPVIGLSLSIAAPTKLAAGQDFDFDRTVTSIESRATVKSGPKHRTKAKKSPRRHPTKGRKGSV